jgi:hypothetical protein
MMGFGMGAESGQAMPLARVSTESNQGFGTDIDSPCTVPWAGRLLRAPTRSGAISCNLYFRIQDTRGELRPFAQIRKSWIPPQLRPPKLDHPTLDRPKVGLPNFRMSAASAASALRDLLCPAQRGTNHGWNPRPWRHE